MPFKRGEFHRVCFLIRVMIILESDVSNIPTLPGSPSRCSPLGRKWMGRRLVAPRKNKKTGLPRPKRGSG